MKNFDFENEVDICARIKIDWNKIDNKTVMITGATGLVGKYFIMVLIRRNELENIHTKIIAVGRSYKKYEERFSEYLDNDDLIFYNADVQKECKFDGKIDILIHMASNTHPRLYATNPIETEMANILGTYNLLQKVAENDNCRFVFTSSGDIYGDNIYNDDFLCEKDCGYIDCNTLRAGYIEGKRASEALCNAFKAEKGVDFVIARLCRIYGPTMQVSDSKAISQFIINACKGEDIVLKSKGEQIFSYLYVFDVVSALLTLIDKGESGCAYNVSDNKQIYSLYNLATMLASISGTNVIFDLPDEEEKKGASNFKNVKLDAGKLYELGWEADIDMEYGLKWTIKKLRDEYYN